jgi:hypothetical protein
MRRIDEWDFKEHHRLIYDPNTGYDKLPASIVGMAA